MDDLPNDILDIICKDLIKQENDIFRKLSWKYRKIYLKNIKYLPIKLYKFNNDYITFANIYLKDKILYVLNGYFNDKIFNFNILNKKIDISNNDDYYPNTLIFEYNNDIYTMFGYKSNIGINGNIIKNNEIIYQNSECKRFGHTGILYKNNVYIFGGRNFGLYLNDLLIYNLDTNTIKRYETNLNPRIYHKAVLYENEMYIFR